MPLFQTLTDQLICDAIDLAEKRVILSAPGISMVVAESLASSISALGRDGVQVVLDISANAARLGYGDHKATLYLQGTEIKLRLHSGLRMGTLICDDEGWCFAMSPCLVETNPQADSEAFNAIKLTTSQIDELLRELPPVTTPDLPPPKEEYSLVGSEPVSHDMVEKVTRALEIAPPQTFDLARQTQVYVSFIQFVELSYEGFNIQSRRIKLPSGLPLIASKDKTLKERVIASLRILEKFEKPALLSKVSDDLNQLREAYLIPVGQAGRIIMKSKKDDFESELKAIQDALDRSKEVLQLELNTALMNVMESIVADLARAVLADPPPIFRGRYPHNEESAFEYVRSVLSSSFPTGEKLVENMKIHLFYKDVTYATLKDPSFAEMVEKAIPKSLIKDALLQEEVVVGAGESAMEK